MEYLVSTVIFILGLLIGSFLNVCIYRIPEGISVVSPPSNCPKCETRLKPWDLVPVFSWIFLGGKCRYCKEKISARYMLVELLTGILFVLCFMTLGLTFYLLAALILTSVLIAVTFIDIDTQTIPNGIVIFALATGLVLVFTGIVPGQKLPYWANVLDAVYGMAAGFLPLLLINLGAKLILKKEGMGGGDMKLMAAAGLFLGLKLTIVSLLIAIYAGGITGAVILLVSRIKRNKADEPEGEEKRDNSGHYIAFGPFLAAGAYIAMLYGNMIVEWYIKIVLG